MPDAQRRDADRLGRRVFLNVAEGGDLYLWALDRSNGRGPMEADARRRRPRHAQAEHVVAVTGDRRHRRVGADGHRRPQGLHFRRQGAVGARHSEGLRAFGLNWGYASSPLLLGDALYVQVLHGMKTDDPSYVMRIDKKTGKTVWRSRAADQGDRRIARRLHDAGAAARRAAGRRSSSPAATSSPAHDPATGQGALARRRAQPREPPVAPHRRIAGGRAATSSTRRARVQAAAGDAGRRSRRRHDDTPAVAVRERAGRADAGHRRHVLLHRRRPRRHLLPRRQDRQEVYGPERIKPGTYSASPVLGRRQDLHHERGRADDGGQGGAGIRGARRRTRSTSTS